MSVRATLALVGLLAASLVPLAHARAVPWTINTARLGLMKQTSVLLGKPVRDVNGQIAGRVTDLLVDLPAGKVIVVLVATGKDGRVRPVPPQGFCMVFQDRAELQVTSETLESGPLLGAALDGDTYTNCYAHFGCQPSAGVLPPGGLTSGAALLGSRLVSEKNEPLGRVEDLMVDVTQGQLVYLVVAPAFGAAGDLYAIPPLSVTAGVAARVLNFKGSKAHFAAGPRFTQQYWTDIVFPKLADAVVKHYGLPAPVKQPDPQAMRAETASTKTGATTVPSRRTDREITQAVLTELVREGRGLFSLNIVVTTVQGRVILTGPVKNEKLRKQVVAAAERVVGAANVEDRLQVKGRKAA